MIYGGPEEQQNKLLIESQIMNNSHLGFTKISHGQWTKLINFIDGSAQHSFGNSYWKEPEFIGISALYLIIGLIWFSSGSEWE